METIISAATLLLLSYTENEKALARTSAGKFR